jgi:hypothetical protein
MFHGCHEIEILEVECHELGIGRKDDTVQEKLDLQKVCCRGSTVSGVIPNIAAHCDSYVVLVLLSIMIHAYYPCILFVPSALLWNSIFLYEKMGSVVVARRTIFLQKVLSMCPCILDVS